MDRDDRALGRGLDGDLGADPAAAPGDEHDPTGQGTGHQAAATGRAGRPAGAAVDPRRTTSVGRISRPGSSPARTPVACSNPRRPISRSGNRTVDRLGAVSAGGRDVVEAGHRHRLRDRDPELGQPPERTEREQVVGATDRGERHVRGQQRVDPERAAVRVEARPDDEPLVERRSRPSSRPCRYPASRARATNSDRGPARNAIRRWPSATSAATIAAIPAALSTPTSGSPRACGERWTIAAPSARIAARWRSISSLTTGSSSPLPAKTTAAARIERSSRTYDRSRSASRSEEQVMTRNPATDAASSTPADDLREIRVGDVVDDDRDDRDPALEQPAGEGVRDVVERPGRLEHALAGRGADRVVRGRDDARRRGRRHAGEPGDLGDRCHQRRAARLSTGTGTSAGPRAR